MINFVKGKKLAWFLILLSLVPVAIFVLDFINDGFFTKGDELWVVGALFGLVAFIFLWWGYILGFRGTVALFTQDLFGFNSVHKFLGIYGFFLILLHPILMIVDSWQKKFTLNLVGLENDYQLYMTMGTIAFILVIIIWLTSKIIRKKFSYRTWKRIHYLTYFIIVLVYFHSMYLGVFFEHRLLKTYWNLLFLTFIIVFCFRVLFKFGFLRKSYKVEKVDYLTQDTVHLTFRPDGKFIKPKAGQFVYLQLGAFGESHPYTVAHFDEKTGEIGLGIKFLGESSGKVRTWDPGQTAILDGPYGIFLDKAYDNEDSLVFIAGGIGVTPFMRVIEDLRNGSEYFKNKDMYLFYGARDEDDIAYREEIDEVAKNNPRFKVIYVMSEIKSENSVIEYGFITTKLLEKYLEDKMKNSRFFLCGPSIMIDKLNPPLIKAGVTKDKLFNERFDF